MLLAHLSDLHLRDESDAVEFDRQLDCIAAEGCDHLVLTGDVIDRWDPPLLERALDALAARRLLDPAKFTIIHGNHDLASSGGHPRQRRDLWRLVLRFWDPPPLLRRRRARFYQAIAARCPGAAPVPPFTKTLKGEVTLAALDSVPFPWMPFTVGRDGVSLQHARGAIAARDTRWLAAQKSAGGLIVLIHHYPLEAGEFRWRYGRWRRPDTAVVASAFRRKIPRLDNLTVAVPMDIADSDRQRFWQAIEACGAFAVLCGHVHRARLDSRGGVAVGLNGQSGADWAGRTIAFYRVEGHTLTAEFRDGAGRRPDQNR